MRRIRWRRVGKWAGAVIASLIFAAWSVSGWRSVYWERGTSSDATTIGLGSGTLFGAVHWSSPEIFESTGWLGRVRLVSFRECGVAVPRWFWQFSFQRWPNGAVGSPESFAVPLWAPWLVMLLPTIWLWRLDRRRPPGVCRTCGYDLTGNATGVCPECGKARAAEQQMQQTSR